MKKRLSLILGAAFLFCSAGSASALFFSDTQHQNLWFDGLNQSYTWSFDLDSDILDWGDIDSDDDIHSAYLWFGTYDQHDGFEYTDIYLNIQQVVNNWEVDTGWWTLGNVTAFIGSNHLLNISFERIDGDFGVSWVNLHGHYTDNSQYTAAAPVPEPATMLLLGTGLIGIAGTSRKVWIKR